MHWDILNFCVNVMEYCKGSHVVLITVLSVKVLLLNCTEFCGL